MSETEIPDAAYEVAWEAFRRIAVGPALVDEDAAVAVVVDAVAPLLFQAGRDHERQKIGERELEIAEWLEYRGLPPGASLKTLIEHERATARLAGVFDAMKSEAGSNGE